MALNANLLESIQKNVSELIARSPAADLEKNMKAMLTSTFQKMDLVTREEFDTQMELLARTRLKLEQLELQIQALEKSQNQE